MFSFYGFGVGLLYLLTESFTIFGGNLASSLAGQYSFTYSIAFANFKDGVRPFHLTSKNDFLESANISLYSLVALSNALKDHLDDKASVATISISNTKATAYGMLGPIKAALDSSVAFLAKSFWR